MSGWRCDGVHLYCGTYQGRKIGRKRSFGKTGVTGGNGDGHCSQVTEDTREGASVAMDFWMWMWMWKGLE